MSGVVVPTEVLLRKEFGSFGEILDVVVKHYAVKPVSRARTELLRMC